VNAWNKLTLGLSTLLTFPCFQGKAFSSKRSEFYDSQALGKNIRVISEDDDKMDKKVVHKLNENKTYAGFKIFGFIGSLNLDTCTL